MRNKSIITGLPIQASQLLLEDGNSSITLSEAIMWYKVNPFSPLATGWAMSPF
jgi:hypothetical protein